MVELSELEHILVQPFRRRCKSQRLEEQISSLFRSSRVGRHGTTICSPSVYYATFKSRNMLHALIVLQIEQRLPDTGAGTQG